MLTLMCGWSDEDSNTGARRRLHSKDYKGFLGWRKVFPSTGRCCACVASQSTLKSARSRLRKTPVSKHFELNGNPVTRRFKRILEGLSDDKDASSSVEAVPPVVKLQGLISPAALNSA